MKKTRTYLAVMAMAASVSLLAACSNEDDTAAPADTAPPPAASPADPMTSPGASPSTSPTDPMTRSEEHTSELQSRENLVCRLLLEKKKRTDNHNITT